MKSIYGIALVGLVLASQVNAGPRESAIAEILAAEKGFCAMAQEKGYVAAYAAYVAPDAKMVRPGQRDPVPPPDEAKAAAAWPAQTRLTWAPEHADASEDGSLGYTWGRLVFHSVGADGKSIEARGNYSIVWKRQPDQRWKVVLDISTPGAKAAPD